MGVDSRGVHRGECSLPGCQCKEFQRVSGTSKCSTCNHPPASHKVPQQGPYSDHEDSVGISGWQTCPRCGTGYSLVDLGACPKCCPRESCKSGCGKPAFCTVDLSSFGYCSSECRDRRELERAKSEVSRALEEFEVNPGRGSTQAPAKEPVSYGATGQPLTRAKLQSTDTPTSKGTTHGSPPTQQPTPLHGAVFTFYHYEVSLNGIRAMSFYNSGKIEILSGTRGILVSSIEVNKDTLKCSVQPLDLITQFDDKSVDSLCDQSGRCELIGEMSLNSVSMWVARIPGIPHIAYLQKVEEPPVRESSKKQRVVGFLVTQKDLEDPALFLGVYMDEQSSRRVNHVKAGSEGYKAGLRENDIIRSVTVVTAEGIVGPDTEWSFEGIKRIARDSPSVCALLMTVVNS